MTRMSKQSQRRAVSRKRPKLAGKKTGAKKDNLQSGFKEHENALSNEISAFIPKIK